MCRVTAAIAIGSSSYRKISSMSTRMRYLFLIAVAFGGSYFILSITKLNVPRIMYINQDAVIPHWKLNLNNLVKNVSDISYVIKTNGCNIPAMPPLGEEIIELVQYPENIMPCPNSNTSLLANNRTHIWVKNENKQFYNISNGKNFHCCYKAFYRPLYVDDITSFNNDERVEYELCKFFLHVIEATDEFVRVTCTLDEIEVYQQFFLFAPKKKFRSHNFENETTDKTPGYNVIVMGIDAVSRLNFHRTMPQTLAFLTEKGAVELLGYNKVGDNTFPNIIPMLMGISEKELKTTCIPNKRSSFDNCPFIWEWFKEERYYTAFGEDSSSLGTFNFENAGFVGTPTDYYIHTFISEAETYVGVNKDYNSLLCMNDKRFYAILLEYIENLLWTLRSDKIFGFFWEVTMSHDYLNYPMAMDRDYATFLKKLELNSYLNKTILILVSDHGLRWGKIRTTTQGRLEERLPFVFLLAPQDFRNKFSEAYRNLELNSRRLTTPYDLHATLFDLTNLENIQNQKIILRSNESYLNSKGISLFLPIPTSRTCAMAHIDDHWCSCLKGNKLSIKSSLALQVATQLVRLLNNLLRDYTQCARLKLKELVEATEITNSSENDEVHLREYMAVIRTKPGDALFEGTLRFDGKDWSISGTVSRINLYRNQSRCMHNYLLKLYCYCQ